MNPNLPLKLLIALSIASCSFSMSDSENLKWIDSSSGQVDHRESTVRHSDRELRLISMCDRLNIVLQQLKNFQIKLNSSGDNLWLITIFENWTSIDNKSFIMSTSVLLSTFALLLMFKEYLKWDVQSKNHSLAFNKLSINLIVSSSCLSLNISFAVFWLSLR